MVCWKGHTGSAVHHIWGPNHSPSAFCTFECPTLLHEGRDQKTGWLPVHWTRSQMATDPIQTGPIDFAHSKLRLWMKFVRTLNKKIILKILTFGAEGSRFPRNPNPLQRLVNMRTSEGEVSSDKDPIFAHRYIVKSTVTTSFLGPSHRHLIKRKENALTQHLYEKRGPFIFGFPL